MSQREFDVTEPLSWVFPVFQTGAAWPGWARLGTAPDHLPPTRWAHVCEKKVRIKGCHNKRNIPESAILFSPGDGELGLPFLFPPRFLGRTQQPGLSLESGNKSMTARVRIAPNQKGVLFTAQQKVSQLLQELRVEAAEHILGEVGRDGSSRRFSGLCQSF